MNKEHITPPLENLPGVYRITSIQCLPWDDGKGVSYKVCLYHDKAQLTVAFNRSHPDIRLGVGKLVSVRWHLPVRSIEGSIRISRLVLIEIPLKGFNLFETVPPAWVKDRDLVSQAKHLVETLPEDMRQLFTAVFWDGSRFHGFCEGPSSMRDHHSMKNGNLRHTVEVGETVELLARLHPKANLGICIAAALLHDAGKAVEYSYSKYGTWAMSDRGKLVGHRHTVLEWIAVAISKVRILMSEQRQLSLLHALTAAPNAEWLGIRPPMSPEATLLSMADRLSGERELIDKLANRDGGWGNRFPYRKGSPFTVLDEEMKTTI